MNPITHPYQEVITNHTSRFEVLNKDLIYRILSFLSTSDVLIAFSSRSGNIFLPFAKERVSDTKESLKSILERLQDERQYPTEVFAMARSVITQEITAATLREQFPDVNAMSRFVSEVKASLIAVCLELDDESSAKLLLDNSNEHQKDILRSYARIRQINMRLSNSPLGLSEEAQRIIHVYLENGMTEKAFEVFNTLDTSCRPWKDDLMENLSCKIIQSFVSEGKYHRASDVILSLSRCPSINFVLPVVKTNDVSTTSLIVTNFSISQKHREQAIKGALVAGNLDMLKLLLTQDSEVSSECRAQVIAWCANNHDENTIAFFLPKHEKIRSKHIDRAILSAVEQNKYAIVNILLRAAVLNTLIRGAAVVAASERGNIGIVQLLLPQPGLISDEDVDQATNATTERQLIRFLQDTKKPRCTIS